jgi:hypothetical protein
VELAVRLRLRPLTHARFQPISMQAGAFRGVAACLRMGAGDRPRFSHRQQSKRCRRRRNSDQGTHRSLLFRLSGSIGTFKMMCDCHAACSFGGPAHDAQRHFWPTLRISPASPERCPRRVRFSPRTVMREQQQRYCFLVRVCRCGKARP